MKKIALVAAAATAVFATPALAQSETTDQDMGGVFVGAVVGYDSMSIETPTEDGSIDGLLYGLNVSYDVQSGSGLFGIEAEITDTTASRSANDVLAVGDSASVGGGRDIYAGIRAGLVIDEGEAVYLKAGYTNASFDLDLDVGGTELDLGDDLDGLRLGAGYETTIAGFSARFEYRYSDYQELEVVNVPTGVLTENHQAVIVIGKRF